MFGKKCPKYRNKLKSWRGPLSKIKEGPMTEMLRPQGVRKQFRGALAVDVNPSDQFMKTMGQTEVDGLACPQCDYLEIAGKEHRL